MHYGSFSFGEIKPSRLVFGTIPLNEDNLEAGFELLDAAWETGYTAFDTAALYGGGSSERVLGKWMEARGNRNAIFVIGKGAHHNARSPGTASLGRVFVAGRTGRCRRSFLVSTTEDAAFLLVKLSRGLLLR